MSAEEAEALRAEMARQAAIIADLVKWLASQRAAAIMALGATEDMLKYERSIKPTPRRKDYR